jgi:outer membrane protein assembly factor BamE (lipoprotein component of BamABCDE complex)
MAMARQSSFKLALAGAAALGLGACYANLEVRGYIPDEELLAKVAVGLPKSEIEVILGSPSAAATFSQPEIWYYISRRVERVAFLEEKLIDQRVVEVEFDQGGRVSGVKRYAATDRREIVPVERVTPTHGKELSALEQLFGNVGRFNKASDSDGGGRRLPDPMGGR